MNACRLMLVGMLGLVCAVNSQAQDERKPRRPGRQNEEQRPRRPGNQNPAQVFDQFDKNKDGFLDKDELPERMQARIGIVDVDKDGKVSKEEYVKAAERFAGQPGNPPQPPGSPGQPDVLFRALDANRDGKISKEELEAATKLLERLDRNKDGFIDVEELRVVQSPPSDVAPEVVRRVAEAFDRMDENKDGKISKDEAKGPLVGIFERVDANGDGSVDRPELRQAFQRFAAQPGGGPAGGVTDRPRPAGQDKGFDDLDKDVDGRLTREELKGTTFEKNFDDLDTNKDGKVDPKEFEAFLKKRDK